MSQVRALPEEPILLEVTMKSLFLIALIFLSACSSIETADVNAPPKDAIVHNCIYDAMDETLVTREMAWWDSRVRNCASTVPHRGRILLTYTELPKKGLCAQFFHFAQTYEYGIINTWSEYTEKILTACFSSQKGWIFYKDDKILDTLVLDEILGYKVSE